MFPSELKCLKVAEGNLSPTANALTGTTRDLPAETVIALRNLGCVRSRLVRRGEIQEWATDLNLDDARLPPEIAPRIIIT